ncbi:MAG: NADH-quinone oxidoreductase subunit M [Planctomycetes bacterium]|nr:NADH-quinone oxidoreductase subunit M [Planctomycetota bacterium]
MLDGLLLASILLPMLGALAMGLLAPLGDEAVRRGALAVALATLAASTTLVANYPANGAEAGAFATVVRLSGEGAPIDVRFHVALDGLGLWMFALAPVLLVTSILASWRAIADRTAMFHGMLLLLTGGCLGVFTARDIMLFYVFFEFTLIPLFFLIGIWGSEERRYAAIKFFLFTLAGSLLTFLGLLAIVVWDFRESGGPTMQFSLDALNTGLRSHPLPEHWQTWIFLALFAGFAVKVPLFPLHTWLPLAHVQAPTAGSVFLAGILLKIGTYGFLRFCLPMLPAAAAALMPAMLWLALLGVVYGALVALAQRDIKRLIAYSSVSHMGFCVMGIFALNPLGIQGGVLQMLNHGISTGALFALVGMLYERYHTRRIEDLSGLCRRVPWLAFFMVLFTLSSIGLPGLNGFAGEFLILIGMFQRAFGESASDSTASLKIVSVLAVSGVVLGAWYMLWMVQRVFFGPLREPESGKDAEQGAIADLSWRERWALMPLAALALWIGLYPAYFLNRMAPDLERVSAEAEDVARSRYAPIEYRAERPGLDRRPTEESSWETLTRVD